MLRPERSVGVAVRRIRTDHTLLVDPKVAKITKKEAAKKTGPKRVNWSVTASGRKRKKVAEGGMIHRGRKAEMV